MPTMASLEPRLIPFTPYVLRPIGRASDSAKRMAMPFLVARMTSSPPRVSTTPTSESPSSIAMKMCALAKLAPAAIVEFLPRVVETISGQEMLGHVAEAMARIGRGGEVLVLRKGLEDPDEELALLCGLLRGGDDSVAADALALSRGDAPLRTRIARVARVASALSSPAGAGGRSPDWWNEPSAPIPEPPRPWEWRRDRSG